jgi:hypothetical protein
MSKALLNDVIVLETALPIFYYYRLGLQLRLGLLFPFCRVVVVPFAFGVAHTERLTKRNTQPPTRTPRGKRREGKQERNKNFSRDEKVTTKEKRFRSFFVSRLVCVLVQERR